MVRSRIAAGLVVHALISFQVGGAVFLRAPGNTSDADAVELRVKAKVSVGSNKSANDDIQKQIEELRQELHTKLERSDQLHAEIEALHIEGMTKFHDLDAQAAKLHKVFEEGEKRVQEQLTKANPDNKVVTFFMQELHERDVRIDNLVNDITSLHSTIQFVEKDLSMISQQVHAEFSYVHDHLATTMDKMMGRIIKLESGEAKDATKESERADEEQATLTELQHSNESLEAEIAMLEEELAHLKEMQEKELAMKQELIKELEAAIQHLETTEKEVTAAAQAANDGNPLT